MPSGVAMREWSDEAAREVVEEHLGLRGPLLPVLHALQETFGHLDARAVPLVASMLNLSRAEVHGVISFYRDFRDEPAGRSEVRVCRAEACQALGSDRLADHARSALGVPFGGTTADGAVTLDEVFCLGNCALGPSVMVDGTVHGRVDAQRFDDLVGDLAVEPLPAPPAREPGAGPVTVVRVPADSSARAVGADRVADAIALAARRADAEVRVVRTGSRGLLWCEPMVEVDTPTGRVAYGPVVPEDVPGLLDAGMLDGALGHPLCLGPTEEIGWLTGQQRLVFARVGVVDPLSAEEYVAHGGLAGLRRAVTLEPGQVVEEVLTSGLRGRGGAGFPAGIKWRTVLETPAATKYVCCNGDEGDSGTFADRMLMEGDPFCLLEGMAITGLAVGATEGIVYVRSEYPDAIAVLRRAVDAARAQGWLGDDVLGSGRRFDVEVRVGAGAYICGEETAMLDSIEGRRGMVRTKPPVPAVSGLFGCPTVVNNVLTLASLPAILARGGQAYQDLGTGRSRGTQVFQLAGNVARGGIVEVPFGLTLRELVEDYGGGTASGRPVRAVQVGGPLGSYLAPSEFDLPMDYEAFAAAGAMLGHGGVVVFDDTVDMAAQARFAMAFCAEESCGKCTPCRIGSVRGVEVIDRLVAGGDRGADLLLLQDLCDTMTEGSLCAMGGLTPQPVRSALRLFPEDFGLAVPEEATS